jgi:hypothetical protein
MDKGITDNDFEISPQRTHLKRLNYYLNFEISSVAFYLLFLFLSSTITIIILGSAALIFTPYMLFVLFKEKKTGWLVSFFVVVILPLIAGMLFYSPEVKSILLPNVTFGTFFLYCFSLKMSTRDWVAAEDARRLLNYQRKMRKLQDDIFFNRFDEIDK